MYLTVIKNIISFFIIFFLFSCAIVPLEKYANYPIINSQNLSKNLSKKDINILIIKNKKEDNKQKIYSKNVHNALQIILASQSYIKLIDRQIFIDTVKETQLAELKNLQTNQELKTADYIITSDFTTSGLKTEHRKKELYKKFNGEIGVQAAGTRFSTKVHTTIKIYKFPSLKIHSILTAKASHYTIWYPPYSINGKNQEENLVNNALRKAINKIKASILNNFLFKIYLTGLKYHQKTNQFLAQIDSGLKDIKKGEKLYFYKENRILHKITKKEEIDIIKLGNGKVSSFITQKRAWVYVDEKLAKKLKIGYWAQKKHKRSFINFSSFLQF